MRRSMAGSHLLSCWGVLLILALVSVSSRGWAAYSFDPPLPLSSTYQADTFNDIFVDMKTDGAGTWVAIWTRNPDLVFSRSLDNGATWSAPAVLKTTGSSGNDREGTLATDGQGNWVAVWRSTDSLGGTIGSDADLLVAHSSDNGATWSVPSALNSNAATDRTVDFDIAPSIVTDGQGHWVVVYANYYDASGSGTSYVYATTSSNNGATWSSRQLLQATDVGLVRGLNPSVATDGQGRWRAVWDFPRDNHGAWNWEYDIMTATSLNNGATWSAVTALNSYAGSDTADDTNPKLACDGQGQWLAAWQSKHKVSGMSGTDTDVLYIRSTDGQTWSAPAPLNGNANSDIGPDFFVRLTPGGQNTWLATWSSINKVDGTYGDPRDMLFAVSTDGGASWGMPAKLAAPAACQDTAIAQDQLATNSVATDGQGRWIVSWSLGGTYLGKSGTDLDIVYARLSRQLAVSPASLSFPAQDIAAGATAPLDVTLENTGSSPLTFTGDGLAFAPSGEFSFVATPDTSVLAPGASRTLQVVFDPTARGARAGTLIVTTDDSTSPTILLALAGQGLARELTVTPLRLNFGEAEIKDGTTAPRDITISNSGDVPVSFTGAALELLGANGSDFAISERPDTATALAVGESRVVKIVFTPAAPNGGRDGVLRITTDAAADSVDVVLRAGAVPVELSSFAAE